MKAPLKTERSLNPAIPLLWLGLAVWGTLAMMSQSNQPGPAGSPPSRWPAESSLQSPSNRPVLIMFVHPHCSCSSASIGELDLLLDHCRGRVNAHILFFQEEGQPPIGPRADLWRQAEVIAGVTLERDENGREAKLFGAATSGDVVLYGTDGRLRFQGGVTLSRGHLGDNPGREALEALISRKPTQVTQTPVFGCPLFPGNLTAER